MGGNFKLVLLYFFLSVVSCQSGKDKDYLIFSKIISENFEVLLNSAEYFDQSKILKNNVDDKIVVDLLDEVVSIETLNSEKKFKAKFGITDNNLKPVFYKIDKIPKKEVNGYPINLISKERNENSVSVQFANFFIDDSKMNSSITVIKRRGIGAISEIYYFKKSNGRWKYEGKDLLFVG